jgi:hypothetical protein
MELLVLIEEIENYLSYIRPSEEIRINLILGIELKSKASSFFVRPDWIDPKKKLKTKLLKS